MGKAEDFRENAKKAEAKANQTSDSRIKAAYLDIARQWRVMADQAERNKP